MLPILPHDCKAANTSSVPSFTASVQEPGKAPVPGEFAERGLFWWTSQQLAFLLRPDDEFVSVISKLKTDLRWEAHRPILGIHIRHGDSCSPDQVELKARTCEDLDVYMYHARNLSLKYGYKSIFLATDDPKMVEATKKYPEFNWLHRPDIRAMREGLYEYTVLPSEFKMDAINYLTDVFMFADADGLVGKFTSNVARLSVALRYGQQRCLYPFVSMDSYWCNDAMKWSGYNPFKKKYFLC